MSGLRCNHCILHAACEGCTWLEQGRAVGRSAGPGWGWAMYEHGKLSAKEATLWAGRQAEVKKVRYVITSAYVGT